MFTYLLFLIGKLRWLACRVVVFVVKTMGEKSVEIVQVDDDQKDAYHLHTTGGSVSLYCSERIYVIRHTAWWVPNRRYINYKVYGTCEGDIPQKLRELIRLGFSIGPMLPAFMSQEDQKKTVLHAYATMLVTRLEQGK